MDLSELRDLLDYLENQGVDQATLRQVFERYRLKGDQGSAAADRDVQRQEVSLEREVLADKAKR
jgi:hypothetical protein